MGKEGEGPPSRLKTHTLTRTPSPVEIYDARASVLKSFGFAANYIASDSVIVDADLSYSMANVDDNNGEGNSLSLIGYLNRSSFDHTQSNILPAISGFEQANPRQVNALGEPVGVSHYLDPANGRSHVMLRRGWSVDDDIGQGKINVNTKS